LNNAPFVQHPVPRDISTQTRSQCRSRFAIGPCAVRLRHRSDTRIYSEGKPSTLPENPMPPMLTPLCTPDESWPPLLSSTQPEQKGRIAASASAKVCDDRRGTRVRRHSTFAVTVRNLSVSRHAKRVRRRPFIPTTSPGARAGARTSTSIAWSRCAERAMTRPTLLLVCSPKCCSPRGA